MSHAPFKLFLFGKHSNRTPLSYSDYKPLYTKDFVFTDSPYEADYLIFGFSIDIRNNATSLVDIQLKNPKVKLVVISEEPLWDTLWSGDYLSKNTSIKCDENIFHYHVLNHCTSNLYNFDKYPYFITTTNDFFVRYANLFQQNAKLSDNEISKIWKQASISQAFYAEKREGEQYNVSNTQEDIQGLSSFRTQVALLANDDNVVRIGQGWSTDTKRQKLPDWHLDKLASLRCDSYIISALENTHHPYYITEKIFDAYAALGIPLYAASKRHTISKILPYESFINLYGLTAEQATAKIQSFKPTSKFIKEYRKTQECLAEFFSDSTKYCLERSRVLAEIKNELVSI